MQTNSFVVHFVEDTDDKGTSGLISREEYYDSDDDAPDDVKGDGEEDEDDGGAPNDNKGEIEDDEDSVHGMSARRRGQPKRERDGPI
jgi:hypothetical protein